MRRFSRFVEATESRDKRETFTQGFKKETPTRDKISAEKLESSYARFFRRIIGAALVLRVQ